MAGISAAATLRALTRKTIFVGALFAVTILPMVYYFAVARDTGTQASFATLLFVIGILGVTHVGMTSYFYVGDRRYDGIIKADPLRYYTLPSIAFAIAFGVFLFAPPMVLFAYFIFHYAWLLWHFNKQNWGILSIFNGSDGLAKITTLEQKAFYALPLGPILFSFTVFPQIAPHFVGLIHWVRVAGASIFAVAVITLFYAAIAAKRFSPLTFSWGILSVIFFIPGVLSTNPAIAIAYYAHPLQYIVMMLFLAGVGTQHRIGSPMARVITALACGLGIWGITWVLGNPVSQFSIGSKIALAFTYGVTQWHFLADTGVWKLRNPEVRKNFIDSFGFMFQK